MKLIANKKTKKLIYALPAVLLVGVLLWCSAVFTPRLLAFFKDRAAVRETLLSHGWRGAAVYVALQALQVIVAFIPGEPVLLAGGYVYGTALASVYIVLGVFAGELLAFFLSRAVGSPLLTAFVSPRRLVRFRRLLNGTKGKTTVFLLFLLPGIPKDILVYLAGISPLRPVQFFIISMVARLPAAVGGAYIGANLQSGNYLRAFAVFGAAAVLCFAGLLLKGPLLTRLERFSRRPVARRKP